MISLHTDQSASTTEFSPSVVDEETEEQLEAGDLMSFAQQIASGMVSEEA